MSNTMQRNRLGGLLPTSMPEFDTLFNHFFRPEEVATWRAPASIWEADNTFHIEVDAPGVAKEDVELTFDKGALSITLERNAPTGDRTNWHNERGYGKLSRSVSLPDSVNPETITAELTNGVLHVTISKRRKRNRRKSTSRFPELVDRRIDAASSGAAYAHGPRYSPVPAGPSSPTYMSG